MNTRTITNEELSNNAVSGGNFLMQLQDGVEDPQYLEHFGRARESRRFYQTIQHRPPRQIMRVNRERVRPIELV